VTRHFLDVTDLDGNELRRVLALAMLEDVPLVLQRRGLAMLFQKPSTRTRHSMEMAIVHLGGHPVYVRPEEIELDVREPVEDVTRILAGYHAGLTARVFDHEVLVRMASVSTVPVINLLSDHSHPMQALADVLTMEGVLGDLAGRTVAYVGDYNNVARSLAEASALLGMHVRIGSPRGYEPPPSELDRIAALGAPTTVHSFDPFEAVKGAHAVHTDVWTSMGQEAEDAERRDAFAGYTVTEEMMGAAAPDAGFYHCLPAHRDHEVAAAVIDGPQSHVFRQGHNRLHAARGLLLWLYGARR
jgi:ornithine carbamoyltransferase